MLKVYNRSLLIYHIKNSSVLKLFLLFSILFTSCRKEGKDSLDYSPAFKVYVENINRNFDKAPEYDIKFLDSVYSTLKNPTVNDKFRLLGYHYILAEKYQHKPSQALLYADSMLNLIKGNGGPQRYPSNYAEANFAIGDAYVDLKSYNDAYYHFFIGYQTGKNYLNSYTLGSYSYRLGMITYKQSHYKLSINYFKDSYKRSVPSDTNFFSFHRNQEVLDNIGLCYYNLNNADSALYYFNKTLNYLNQKGHLFKVRADLIQVAKSVVYANQGAVYSKKGQYPLAMSLLKNSIAFNIKKGNDVGYAVFAELRLAQIYDRLGEHELLTPLLSTIQSQLQTVKNKDYECDLYSLLSSYYESQNKLNLALIYNKRYNLLKDSLAQSSKSLNESNVNEQLNNYEKEYEIQSLTMHNKVQRLYLIIAIAYAIMALIIILLIYRYWRRSKRDFIIVNELNDQVNKQKNNLEKTLVQLHQSSQDKDRILHTVAHDLRNPLGGIASLSNSMLVEDEYSDEQKEYIQIIKVTADNSLDLINEIFEATNTTLVESKKQLVDLNLLLHNTVELLRFKAAEKNQQIVLVPLERPESIFISREKIWRVVSNLIINAIKFSPVSALIEVKPLSFAEFIYISITDHGIGIPEEMHSQVFNIFTEAKRPGTVGEKSFGLGLSICRQIVDSHAGKIWFESNPDGGTTFFVKLPKTTTDITA